MWNRFKTLDPWLFVLPIIMMSIGVVVIYTLTVDSVGTSLFIRQLIFAIIGLFLMVGVTFMDYRALKSWSTWIYLFGLAGLAAVKFLGKSDFGAQRWINIGPFQYQPGELEKLIVIVVIAATLSHAAPKVANNRFLATAGLLVLPVLIVLFQPDLGTALVCAIAGLGIFFHAKITTPQRLLLLSGLLAIVIVFALSFHNVKPFNKLLKDYQKDRLISFVNPAADPTGSGYNVVQSVIAVGSGGLEGKGLGYGTQSQLNFLPVAQADFIFAGIAEAWGLVGSGVILLLYGLLLFRIIQAACIAKDEFGMLLCIGIAVKIAVEMLVNIGMNIRLMPVTGIPLPFLSYGGTTLLTNALCIGLVQSVVIRYKRLTF